VHPYVLILLLASIACAELASAMLAHSPDGRSSRIISGILMYGSAWILLDHLPDPGEARLRTRLRRRFRHGGLGAGALALLSDTAAMTFYLALKIGCCIVSATLAAAVISRDPRMRVSWLMGMVPGCAGIWALCEVVWSTRSGSPTVTASPGSGSSNRSESFRL
jgi:hypothetical protein